MKYKTFLLYSLSYRYIFQGLFHRMYCRQDTKLFSVLLTKLLLWSFPTQDELMWQQALWILKWISLGLNLCMCVWTFDRSRFVIRKKNAFILSSNYVQVCVCPTMCRCRRGQFKAARTMECVHNFYYIRDFTKKKSWELSRVFIILLRIMFLCVTQNEKLIPFTYLSV